MLTGANVLANAVMSVASLAFYLMLFSNAAAGIDAHKVFGKRSYWAVKIGLSFFVVGSVFATLTMPSVTVAQFTRNVGTAILFAWAAIFHAKKWGVVAGVKKLDSFTGTFRIPK